MQMRLRGGTLDFLPRSEYVRSIIGQGDIFHNLHPQYNACIVMAYNCHSIYKMHCCVTENLEVLVDLQ